jgi:cation/acetate symporter
VSAAAVIAFLGTIASTLAITLWAGRRNRSRADFYVAGSRVSALQNALAICGDFLSAATLLGMTALFFTSGADASLYFVGPLGGLALMLFFVAGPVRRLGRFTLADVVCARLPARGLRLLYGSSAILISMFYLVAQIVGAGALIEVLFRVPFVPAVLLVGALMTLYVTIGGMLAATWVQIVKASILVVAVLGLTALALLQAGGLPALYGRAAALHAQGARLFQLGGFGLDLFSATSLMIGLSIGMMGLPHVLIRFFTVPDRAAAERSLRIALVVMAVVFAALVGVVGPATVAFVQGDPRFVAPGGGILGGANMVAIHLASVLGGQLLFGVMTAVAFATILAVVAGLNMAIASAAANDLFRTLRGAASSERAELMAFRIAAVASAVLAMALAVVLRGQNVALIVSFALVISTSVHVPVLLLVLYWPRLTAPGALAGGLTGLVGAVALMTVGPSMSRVLGLGAPLFGSDYPTLLTAPAALLVAVLVSLATAPARQPFAAAPEAPP